MPLLVLVGTYTDVAVENSVIQSGLGHVGQGIPPYGHIAVKSNTSGESASF